MAELIKLVQFLVKEKPKEKSGTTLVDSIADLELKINSAAKTAIESYQDALIALKEYNTNVDEIIEKSIEKTDPKIWTTLKTKTEAKHKNLIIAEKSAVDALKNLDTLVEQHKINNYKKIHVKYLQIEWYSRIPIVKRLGGCQIQRKT